MQKGVRDERGIDEIRGRKGGKVHTRVCIRVQAVQKDERTEEVKVDALVG